MQFYEVFLPIYVTISRISGFYWEKNMRSHIHHNHEDGRKHEKCQFCNRNFKTSKARETHEKLHEGGTNRNIKWCDICQTAWPSTQNLNNHINGIHKKQKNYKCTICDKGNVQFHEFFMV